MKLGIEVFRRIIRALVEKRLPRTRDTVDLRRTLITLIGSLMEMAPITLLLINMARGVSWEKDLFD